MNEINVEISFKFNALELLEQASDDQIKTWMSDAYENTGSFFEDILFLSENKNAEFSLVESSVSDRIDYEPLEVIKWLQEKRPHINIDPQYTKLYDIYQCESCNSFIFIDEGCIGPNNEFRCRPCKPKL